MSLLQTYSGGLAKDIISLDSKSYRTGECTLGVDMAPGDWVKHRWYDVERGFGIIVGVGKRPNQFRQEEDFITVLWSVEPRTLAMGFVWPPDVTLAVTPSTFDPDNDRELTFKVLKNRTVSKHTYFKIEDIK